MIRPAPLAAWLSALALTGCVNLAPEYQRPEAPIRDQWPADVVASTAPADVLSALDRFVLDSRLRQVLEQALANNRDLRVAALNVATARAQYRVQRAEQFPTVDGVASGSHSRAAVNSGSETASVEHQYSVALSLSYELDLFGRLRNLSDAALESYLALEETRRSTQISLVAEVATAWLTLAADQELLQLAKDTLASQQASYDLQQRSHALGNTSGLELAQAQTTVESARVDVAAYQSQVQLDLNALELLVGAPVDSALLPQALEADSAELVALPGELPSSLLQQRPDVLAAEHTLKAANADIGAARAAFFPSINLTGSAGTTSSELAGLFKAGSGAWSFAPSISVPIFNNGANRASLAAARSEHDMQLATYEKTIQTAFSEVADALAVRSTIQARLAAQQALTDATERSYTLADALYRSGASSYLDALDAQRSLYAARQTLIDLRLTEQSNRITLYKALGGGA
ncbi:efflux transporter outer membrane subunit [Stutzerimonas azotifigens]|uniref:efflux transporter outer membrane subunit n=1 Tax=Stutzerimonas azotifigens TaxID=291995 RepID=UPI000410FC10|nr:efflux transporter outer membrane subunit [Stutzerimonas azotifigens]